MESWKGLLKAEEQICLCWPEVWGRGGQTLPTVQRGPELCLFRTARLQGIFAYAHRQHFRAAWPWEVFRTVFSIG